MYNIIEIANTHGGNINYVFSLLKEFEEFNKIKGFGIKFQPFKYNEIATEDFEWYSVYKKLFFTNNQWKEILSKAFQTKDIWIDLFDFYGIEIIKDNKELITGLKLQTSILENQQIYSELKNLKCNKFKLIINIAGREILEINNFIKQYEKLGFEEILLEVGFQAYPTKIEDSGLNKIEELKKHFSNKIVFADHIDGKHLDSQILPSIAILSGADIIEKHIMHSTKKTEYDHFSSLTIDKYRNMIEMQKRYYSLNNQLFINEREKEYLVKSNQIPILIEDKKRGDLISQNDFLYKRTNQTGLNSNEIKDYVENYYVCSSKLRKDDALHSHNFKKANIAVIIACRMKSTRLPQKAILKIGDLSSIETCIKNSLKFKNVNNVILATSYVKEDEILKDYTYSDSVVFHKGHPEDVVQRYLDIIDELKIDVFLRVTGDCPYISADIAGYLLKKHFEAGADYTNGKDAAVGTNMEIINANALRKVKKHFPSANYSEYMTWYFQNNPEHFKLNIVDLPKKWVKDYRLTLDYQEDLDLFNEIEKYLIQNKLEYTIDGLFKFLNNNPEIASINSHLTLKYKTDQKLIDTLNEVTKIK